MVGVVAILKAQEGKGDEMLAILKDLAVQVNANEPGCLMYKPYRKAGEPNTVYMLEEYENHAALEAHGQTEYFKAAGPKFAGVLAGAPEITVLEDA